jgi:hypothetical protein
VQSKPDDLELLIKRFIRSKLRGLKPRDVDYTVAHIRQQMDCIKKWNASKVGEEFYRRYRLGLDTFAPLDDKEFYKTLSIYDFPNLFVEDKTEEIDIKKLPKKSTAISPQKEAISQESQKSIEYHHDLDGIEFPPNYQLVDDRIPEVRRKIISIVKRYIAIMEFDAWISKNGIELPQIEPKSTQKFSSEESKEMEEMIAIIDEHFKDFIQEKGVNEGEYLRLKKLLIDFFFYRDCPSLSKSITAKHRTTKILASILGGIYFSIRNCGISYQYLAFLIANIEQFNKYRFSETNYQRSNLYKYVNIKS